MSVAAVESRGAVLIGPDGGVLELTRDMYRAAFEAAKAAARDGRRDKTVTTGEAASLLGVSRQTLTRMIDAGEIPCQRLGANHHRRLYLEDVVALKERASAARGQSLAKMREAACDAGLYDTDPAR